MTDFYNVFLMMEFFNKTQAETNILLVDGHPKSNLDQTWYTVYLYLCANYFVKFATTVYLETLEPRLFANC